MLFFENGPITPSDGSGRSSILQSCGRSSPRHFESSNETPDALIVLSFKKCQSASNNTLRLFPLFCALQSTKHKRQQKKKSIFFICNYVRRRVKYQIQIYFIPLYSS